MLKEFKDFIMRPGLIDIGVGLVLAAALGAVITALVDNVLMPIVGLIFGEPSFDSVLAFNTAADGTGGIRIGSFITALITFVMIGAAVFFFIIKPYKAVMAKVEGPADIEEPAPDPEDVVLLREIRDALQRG